VILLFKNVGGGRCSLRGYPTVIAMDAGHATIATATHTLSGYLGGVRTSVPTVSLDPGVSASAMVESRPIHVSDGSSCTPYAAIKVTPPGITTTTILAWPSDGCDAFEVHPVVSGTTGTEP
jgi:hypothetical protein